MACPGPANVRRRVGRRIIASTCSVRPRAGREPYVVAHALTKVAQTVGLRYRSWAGDRAAWWRLLIVALRMEHLNKVAQVSNLRYQAAALFVLLRNP